jgi:C-terminal processing protease CtpA/Prc
MLPCVLSIPWFVNVHKIQPLCSPGALVVDSLVQGGPAWESSSQGGLQVGDVLQTVDGKNVYRYFGGAACRKIMNFLQLNFTRWPVSQLAPLLLGAEGTAVRIGVQVEIMSFNG